MSPGVGQDLHDDDRRIADISTADLWENIRPLAAIRRQVICISKQMDELTLSWELSVE